MSLKWQCVRNEEGGYYELTQGVKVPVKIFMNETLFIESEESLFAQVQAATEFPGVKEVVVTPDAHHGYVVPVGCVMATDGTLCQAPIGFDIGCGMLALRSTVDMAMGLDDTLRRRFSNRIMDSIGMGTGVGGPLRLNEQQFEEYVRSGVTNSPDFDRSNSERDYIRVDDKYVIPERALQRGQSQIGSLGGGNHFCELQHDQDGNLWTMVHTGSRGFGHALATHYIYEGTQYLKSQGVHVGGGAKGAEGVYFEPDNPLYEGYRNAVAAGANFAIVNRHVISRAVAKAFKEVFGQEAEMVYEISHNLAQLEDVPGKGKMWVHRKGATRAFPAGHSMLQGTKWEKTGHPILIPGSMGDKSYILYAEQGAEKSLFSVNHGCGRRLSRSAAKKQITQQQANDQMMRLNVMVNSGADVPIDESPDCYKPAEQVIGSVVDAGLAKIAYTLTPIASLKGVD